MSFAPPLHPAYTLLDSRSLPMWNCHGWIYQHQSGARVLSLSGSDDNKTFAVVFPTPPSDHSGLPHILEHCVLCGSEKYPVKEPFKEMLKTSLQTFLNAFTYPDRTCYPVASQNPRDFRNLMEVYLDAVFFPRLIPAVLGQEGWRLQWDADGRAEIQGVVYNEMKGSYANPESRLEELTQQSLFPDNLYRLDYGGNPAHIPELDFEAFTAFHRAHYHPGNAIAGFYGDDDPAARLEILHQVFSRCPAGGPPSPLAELQQPWPHTRRVSAGYPAGGEGDDGAFCQLNWLLPGDSLNGRENMRTSLASYLLLHSPASPLRRDLLDSGLGDEVLGGASQHLRQPTFGAGLRGVAAGDEEQVFARVLDSLRRIVREDFRPDFVLGALNSTEFRMREMNTSNRGLQALLTGSQCWMYGGDPLAALDPVPDLESVRREWEKNPRLFADWVEVNLLSNSARTEVVLAPDPELGAKERMEEAARIEALETKLRADENAARAARGLVEEVRLFQHTPDSPEALARLPSLGLDDIVPLPPPTPLTVFARGGVEVSTSTLHSNGILYLQLAFDFRHLTLEELPLLPLYTRGLTELGTASRDSFVFSEELACHTGGISVHFETSRTYQAGESLAVMLLKAKCLEADRERMLTLVADMLAAPRLGPPDKLFQLLQEERAGEEAEIIQSGNQLVSLRLRAALSPAERVSEELDGLSYLHALRQLEREDPEAVAGRVRALHRRLIRRGGLRIHLGGDADALARALAGVVDSLLEAVPADEAAAPAPQVWPLLSTSDTEGLVYPSPVQFVGMATRLPELGPDSHFSHFVAQRLINSDYLWERVRMQGGAYGSSCALSHLEGDLVFTSYRDPQIEQTLQVYLGAADWLRGLDLSPSSLEQAVIGTLGKLSPPERPSSRVSKSFFRHLLGLKHARRERFHAEIRETTPAHLRQFADQMEAALRKQRRVCVLGGEKALRSAGERLQLTRV